MDFREFLTRVHELLEPATYFEIGVRHGQSLELAHCPSVGIDPAFDLHVELAARVSLFEQTSDDYFAGDEVLAPFGGEAISLALIDGMHLVEYVLRDLINVERHSRWNSVAIVDDVLPRRAIEARRDRDTRFWTGDVYKIARILERLRPDLSCLKVATDPTGVLLILGLDAGSTTLSDRYERIARRAVRAGRWHVPSSVLKRRGALDPHAVLSASFWSVLRDGAVAGESPAQGRARLREALARDFAAPR